MSEQESLFPRKPSQQTVFEPPQRLGGAISLANCSGANNSIDKFANVLSRVRQCGRTGNEQAVCVSNMSEICVHNIQ